MMDTAIYKTHLEQLRRRYRAGEMSALVGAGFSKNISDEDYPSWKSLLSDMVKYLYEHEIAESYKEHTHVNSLPRSKRDYDCFVKQKIERIINRDGYLDIVDKYIEKKGFRESVETYIEDHTPFLDKGFLCVGGEKKPIDKNKLGLHEKLLRCSWENLFTTNYDNALEYVAKIKNISRERIVSSSDLSFSKLLRPIIKIHGSFESDGKFSFDGRNDKKYVISKRDYERYTEEHEAFTQFMRISLLKGCFCLFGFSGNDPNFVSWIKWVRDVLLKAPENANQYKKVFLLSVEDALPSKEQMLFYDNHKIAYIPLKSNDVKEVLGVSKEELDIKTIYGKFFDFLREGASAPSYNELWDNVYNEHSKRVNVHSLERIKEARQNVRFHKFIWGPDRFLQRLDDTSALDSMNPELAELLLIALEEAQYPTSYYSIIQDNLTNYFAKVDLPDLSRRWDYLQLRLDTLEGNKTDLHDVQSDEYIYENLLRLSFSFELDEVKIRLSQWTPQGRWIQQKAMLMSMFDVEFAKEMLLNYTDETEDESEKYLSLQLLNIVDHSWPQKYSTVDYENKNLDDIHSMLKSLSDGLNGERERVYVYGRTPSQQEGGSTLFLSSFRLLQYLINTGSPIGFGSLMIMSGKSWYNVFQHLYEHYPLPCLFYSIQLSSIDDTLKRIGQDFAYNDSLRAVLPNILTMLLKAYNDPLLNPRKKQNILTIAKQMLVSVSPSVWEDQLMKVWKTEIISDFEKANDFKKEYELFEEGLSFLSIDRKNEILKDCLEHASENRDLAWKTIRDLRLKSNRNMPSDVTSSLNAFIDKMFKPDDIIVVTCAEKYLNLEQRKHVAKQILEIANDKSLHWSPNAIYCACSFLKHISELESTLKGIILRHPLLFDNGINGNKITDPERFISFQHIKNNARYNLKLDKQQATTIYNILHEKLHQLPENNFFNRKSDTPDWFNFEFDFIPLLKEMTTFLKDNEKNLLGEKNYQSDRDLITSLLQLKRCMNSPEEAILSEDHSVLKNGIDLLFERIAEDGIAANESAIQLLIDRVLLKKPEAFIYVLSATYVFLSKYKWNDVKFLEDKLLLMLTIYKGNACVNLNVPVPSAYYYLVKIALLLKKNGKNPEGESIKYWLGQMRTKRYNTLAKDF